MMSKARQFFCFCLFTALNLGFTSNAVFAQNPRTIKIVAQGEPAPRGSVFGSFLSFGFNDNEDFAFGNEIKSFNGALFLTIGNVVSPLVADGDSIPGIGKINRLFASGSISLNNAGAMAFGAQAALNGSAKNGLFLADAKGISKLVDDGEPTAGGALTSLSLRTYSLNNAGAVVFQGFLSSPSRQVIFLKNAGGLSKVVATGDPTPLGGTFSFGFLNLWDFNDAGAVLFGSEIANGSSTKGLFIAQDAVIAKIIAVGDRAPDGKKFNYFDNSPALNNLGDVIFEASVGEGFNVDYTGLFLFSNGTLSLIAKTGDAAPGGGKYSVFSGPLINDTKQIIFDASIDGGNFAYGYFRASSGVIEKIVAKGDPTPLGGTFSNLGGYQLNAGGAVAFLGYVTGGSAATGIFLWNGGPRIAVSRDKVEFDNAPPGETARVNLEVISAGGKPLTVQEITDSGPPFGLENVPSLPFTLEPEQKKQFIVTYSPSSSRRTANFLNKTLQDGALTIKTNTPHSSTVVPLTLKATILKVDIVPSQGTEIKTGQSATIEIKVVNQSNQIKTDFDGSVTITLLEDKTTPGITRFPVSQSVLISRGVAQPVLFFTPKEPFSANKPIDAQTVLSGKAVIEVKLENSNIPAVTKEISVKSPLDFFVDRIEIQQGIKDSDKEVTLQYKPGENRTFPALPFIAEHNTAMRVFINYNNTVPIAFSRIDSLVGFSGELRITQGANTQGHFTFTGPNSTRFFFRDSYKPNEEIAMLDGLFTFIAPEKIKDSGTYTFDVELKLEANLEEAANEKSNNKKSFATSFVATNPLRLLATVGAYVGKGVPTVDNNMWDFLKQVYPIQLSKLRYNDPNTMVLSLNEGWHSIGGFLFFNVTPVLNRFNKENPSDQRDRLVVFVDATTLADICGGGNNGCTDTWNGANCFVGAPFSQQTIAHEIGHAFGLNDTYTGFFIRNGEPNPRRSNATNDGNRVENGHIHLIPLLELTSQSPPYFDIMGSSKVARWVDRLTWDYLYRKISKMTSQGAALASSTGSSEAFIAISGIITKTDSIALNSFLTLSQVPEVSESQGGKYSLELLNTAGTSLQIFNFDLEFIMPHIGEVNARPFSFYLPLPVGTSKVVMKKNGINIASRTFSTHPPTVRLLSPAGAATLSNVTTVRWSASDPDRDPLTYDLLYSPDGKQEIVVAVNLTDTTFQFNPKLVPPSASAFVTVVANDGLNEGRAKSAPLIVTGVKNDHHGEEKLPMNYTLGQNYPNPFPARGIYDNPGTSIQYDLPKASRVTIEIFNTVGQKIRTLFEAPMPAGSHAVSWDGRMDNGESATSGVYIYRLHTGEFSQSKRLLLLR